MLLNRVKTLLGVTDNDELIYEIIEITRAKILNYINQEEFPKELEFILIEIAIERYNQVGSEGIVSESSDGVSFTYNTINVLEKYKNDLDRYVNNNSLKGLKGMRLIWGLIL